MSVGNGSGSGPSQLLDGLVAAEYWVFRGELSSGLVLLEENSSLASSPWSDDSEVEVEGGRNGFGWLYRAMVVNGVPRHAVFDA